MSHHVRRTLTALAVGTAVQRGLGLLITIVIIRHLGLPTFGEYAFGLQIAALLGLMADVGIRTLAAREVAREPRQGVALLHASMRPRLLRATAMAIAFAAVAGAVSDAPAFFFLCAALVPLSVLDMKQLADALGRVGDEVRCDAIASTVYLALTALALACGGGLVALALAYVGSRVVYAIIALRWLVALPAGEPVVGTHPWRHADTLGLAQVGFELAFASPIVLLRAFVGSEAVGLLAAAQKIVLAADTPVRVLGRVLTPHLSHASRSGDSVATLDRAVRASAHLVLPIAAGGCIVAEPLLLLLCGPAYAAATWPLRFLLLGTAIVGPMSQYAQALIARGAWRGYVQVVAIGVAAYATMMLALLPTHGAAGAALASSVGLCCASLAALCALRAELTFPLLTPWPRPLLHTAVVIATTVALQTFGVLVQLGGGAVAFAVGLFVLEMRGRTSELGVGLQRSSGFMAEGENEGRTRAPTTELVEAGR